MKVSPLAGKPADLATLVNLPRLVTAYYTETPDPSTPEQRVAFGTLGHRGSLFDKAFNEWHILAISQAICQGSTERPLRQALNPSVEAGSREWPFGAQ
jgi:phosphoglucomutase